MDGVSPSPIFALYPNCSRPGPVACETAEPHRVPEAEELPRRIVGVP